MIFTAGKTDVAPHEVGYDEGRLEVLKRHFQNVIDEGSIQCAMYCISRHGKVFAHGAVGKKSFRPEDNTPAQPDSIRWYASMTKVVTATAIMKLVEDGLTRLNVPVGEILPQFNVPPYNSINLLHLLTHTSGLHADNGCFDNPYQHGYWQLIGNALEKHDKSKIAELDWIKAALGTIGSGMRTRPGEEWAYSSFGFVVLGAVIEKLTGVHANDYIMKYITQPLGMVDTFFGDDMTPEWARRSIVTNEEAEKEFNEIINGTSKPNDWDVMRIPGTTGSLEGTAKDMNRFGNMFLNGGTLDGARILGRKTVQRMTSKHIDDLPNFTWGNGGAPRSYCVGFDLRTDQPFLVSPTTYSHEGAGASSIYIDPVEEMVATWFVPYTGKEGWVVKGLFNTCNVIWSGLV
ncbi:MAG: beta-lactamase family protein [Defluviitaleaceae bacterium]|nr:beta-lactamase family protein [Defluviitaleaceae bacterium]